MGLPACLARHGLAAWRHVVKSFWVLGATNVTWLWAPNAEEPGTPPLSAYWPGARYVTWVGLDGYLETWTDTFSNVFSQSIAAIRRLTAQPLLIAETAVGPIAGQVAKIGEIFSGMQQYHLLGIVWFDVAQQGGITNPSLWTYDIGGGGWVCTQRRSTPTRAQTVSSTASPLLIRATKGLNGLAASLSRATTAHGSRRRTPSVSTRAPSKRASSSTPCRVVARLVDGRPEHQPGRLASLRRGSR